MSPQLAHTLANLEALVSVWETVSAQFRPYVPLFRLIVPLLTPAQRQRLKTAIMGLMTVLESAQVAMAHTEEKP